MKCFSHRAKAQLSNYEAHLRGRVPERPRRLDLWDRGNLSSDFSRIVVGFSYHEHMLPRVRGVPAAEEEDSSPQTAQSLTRLGTCVPSALQKLYEYSYSTVLVCVQGMPVSFKAWIQYSHMRLPSRQSIAVHAWYFGSGLHFSRPLLLWALLLVDRGGGRSEAEYLPGSRRRARHEQR